MMNRYANFIQEYSKGIMFMILIVMHITQQPQNVPDATK